MDDCILYHYTSMPNLERIIKSGNIQLNDIVKSNDPAEGIFALDALESVLIELYKNDKLSQDTYRKLRIAFFDFKSELDCFGRLNQIVLSLSVCNSAESLALWRCYGNNGKGVALGFSKDKLEKAAGENGLRFDKIQYLNDKEIKEKAVIFWNDNKSLSEDKIIENLNKFYLNGYFIKREENSFENEYRLLYSGMKAEDYILIADNIADNIDIYATEDDLKIYYNLPLMYGKNKCLLDQIQIGPQCRVSEPELKILLKKCRFQDCNIFRSRTVMR